MQHPHHPQVLAHTGMEAYKGLICVLKGVFKDLLVMKKHLKLPLCQLTFANTCIMDE